MRKQKVLLVTAKWPEVTASNDGGDSTVREIISSIGASCMLDMLCFRDDLDSKSRLAGIHRIIFYREDFAVFCNYEKHDQSKFLCRIQQSKIAADMIRRIHKEYDIILVQHNMFLLDLAKDCDILRKSVLFPMFTGTSYVKAGEAVPKEYLELEKKTMPLVKTIISPSCMEKQMMVQQYQVPSDIIRVIPRQISMAAKERKKTENRFKLIYVASIRMQKCHMEAVRLVRDLKKEKHDIKLRCVGAIQDNVIYRECIEYIEKFGLEENIEFCGNKSVEEVTELFNMSDINISMSKWETFGRGIYEGMAMGLPTIVLKELRCVTEAENIGVYPMIAEDTEDMKRKILTLFSDDEVYCLESLKYETISKKLNREWIEACMRSCILG